MELIYAAYLMLRQGIEDPERRARFGAVYAILGVVSVPLTFFSIRIFRTIHPVVIGGGDPGADGSFDMTPKMLQTFLFSLLTFTVLYADLMWHRIRLGRLAERVEQLKLRLSQ
jgi:heme exporter protein C